jgi:hypothetical protein
MKSTNGLTQVNVRDINRVIRSALQSAYLRPSGRRIIAVRGSRSVPEARLLSSGQWVAIGTEVVELT